MAKDKLHRDFGDELEKTKSYLGLILLCIFLLVVDGIALIFNYKKVDGENAIRSMYVQDASELRVLSQSISASAVAAVNGDKDAFQKLDSERKAFTDHLTNIVQGNPDRDMSPESVYYTKTKARWLEISKTWSDKIHFNIEEILDGKSKISELNATLDQVEKVITSMQRDYDGLVEYLLQANAPPDQIIIAQRQALLAERSKGRMKTISTGGSDAASEIEAFRQDISTFGKVLNGMMKGSRSEGIQKITEPAAKATLNKIARSYNSIKEPFSTIRKESRKLIGYRDSAAAVAEHSTALLADISELNTAFRDMDTDSLFSSQFGFLLGSAGVFIIGLIFFFVIRSSQADSHRQGLMAQERETMLAEQNEESQTAILRLLDEISTLGDGDLTVLATVSEDFTGAIADAINYAIEQLRTLVATINETAVQVAASAQETQATAMHLAEASEHQAQEIAGASAAVNEMAVSIDQVSSNAGESTSVAEKAVDIAKKGSQVVHNTIEGMETIREQIQETSKRIKRLGESSQEIGDIISLITDIADQTNILALNAAIQASMAGDAGRGFAVVADEVQRLAERTSNATKQIEALVKTIQSDTNEAVISMENTTSEVVRGARLAQDAGVALEEIEQVSKALADLIFNISNAARQQSASAGHISNTMNVIQEITSQTSSGTTATARSIGNLAELADQMRKSVAGFKLPR